MRPAYPHNGRSNPVVCGRKFCARCGRWRHAVDFSPHGRRGATRLNSRCRTCVRLTHAEASQRERERRREYSRLWAERDRRARGVPTREQWTHLREPILGRLNCQRCGRWRPVSDFGHHRGGISYTCIVCVRAASRAAVARRNAEQRELRREYERIYKEARRRQAGIPEREWVTRTAPPDPHMRGSSLHRHVDSAALRPHLMAWLRAYAAEHPFDWGYAANRGISALANASTVPERRIYGIVTGESERTHYAVADRLAVAIGLSLTVIYESA